MRRSPEWQPERCRVPTCRDAHGLVRRQAPSPAAPSLDASLASNGALADALRRRATRTPTAPCTSTTTGFQAARGEPPVLARALRARRARGGRRVGAERVRHQATRAGVAAVASALRGERLGPAGVPPADARSPLSSGVVEAGTTPFPRRRRLRDPTPELLLADGVDMVNTVDDRVMRDGAAAREAKDRTRALPGWPRARSARARALLARGHRHDGYDQGALTQALGEQASGTARWPGKVGAPACSTARRGERLRFVVAGGGARRRIVHATG